MPSRSLFVAIFAITINTIIYRSESCFKYFPEYNITFDLGLLTLTNSSNINYYYINDTDSNELNEFYFNLCDNIINTPSSLSNVLNCLIPNVYSCISYNISSGDCIDELDRYNNITKSWAWQIDNNYCYRLGSDGNIPPPYPHYIMSIIDNNDPAFGIAITYLYGDYDTSCLTNKELTLEFICDNTANNLENNIQSISGTNCNPKITMFSKYGCPIECETDNDGNVCSNNGICEYNKLKGVTKCYCYAGFYGNACQQTINDFNYVSGIDFNSNYVYTFNTNYGYNITYDVQYIVKGYGEKGYYHFFEDDYYGDGTQWTNLYVNFFNKTALDDITATAPIIEDTPCAYYNMNGDIKVYFVNITNYSLGYAYTQGKWEYGRWDDTAPNTGQCKIFANTLESIKLYDELEPYHGFTLEYISSNKTAPISPDNGGFKYRMIVNFICDEDDHTSEIYDSIDGLNTYFDSRNTTFRIIHDWDETPVYEWRTIILDIHTITACSANCISFDKSDPTDNTISVCNNNGICGYDKTENLMKCLCDGDAVDPNYCYNGPTSQPTKEPTNEPTNNPTTSNPTTTSFIVIPESTQSNTPSPVTDSTFSFINRVFIIVVLYSIINLLFL